MSLSESIANLTGTYRQVKFFRILGAVVLGFLAGFVLCAGLMSLVKIGVLFSVRAFGG